MGEGVTSRKSRTLHNDPRVMATLSADGDVFSEDQTHGFLQRSAEHWSLHNFGLWIFHASGNTRDFVGYCGASSTRSSKAKMKSNLPYAVSSSHWNKRLRDRDVRGRAESQASKNYTSSESSRASPCRHNKGSRSVMEHCGFTYQRDIIHAGLPHVLYYQLDIERLPPFRSKIWSRLLVRENQRRWGVGGDWLAATLEARLTMSQARYSPIV